MPATLRTRMRASAATSLFGLWDLLANRCRGDLVDLVDGGFVRLSNLEWIG